jgi:putative ABC transport system permease protein
VEVVAIARDAGYLTNRNMFMPQATVRALYQLNDDATGMVMVYLKDIAGAPLALDKLRQAVKKEGFQVLPHDAQIVRKKLDAVRGEDWIGQRLDLTMWKDELGAATWILQTLNSLTALFVSILALIVIAGIINTMWIAVRERTQEIGMLRAIGMSRPRVLTLFLVEALLLGLCATALGSALGAALAGAINAASFHIPVDAVQTVVMSDVLTLSVQPMQVVKTIGLFTAFTAVAALWPALRAARLQPLTAIQHVG